MPRFICFQRSIPSEPTAQADTDGSSMADSKAAFATWIETYGANLADMVAGSDTLRWPCPKPSRRRQATASEVSRAAYIILSADDHGAAAAIARAFPGLVRPGSAVEVI